MLPLDEIPLANLLFINVAGQMKDSTQNRHLILCTFFNEDFNMSRKLFSIAVATFSLIGLSLTGCMLSPNQYDTYSNWNPDVRFQAATLAPNEIVYVQAKHPISGQWQNVGQMTTSGTGIGYAGGMWYYTEGKFKIPEQYWTGAGGTASAEVRTTSASTQGFGMDGMLGFEQGFVDWFWLDKSSNAALDRAVGQSVTIRKYELR